MAATEVRAHTAAVHVLDAANAPVRQASGGLAEHETLGPLTCFDPLEQAVLELARGARATRRSGTAEELLFVLDGEGELRPVPRADRESSGPHRLEPETGVYVPPGERYELAAGGQGPLRLVAVRIPNPVTLAQSTAAEPARALIAVARLSEQETEAATSEREFRIVAEPRTGPRSATQFVGYIPPVRAPDHFHTYDEVIYVLDGEGVFHAGAKHWPVRPGSCIQLPARTVHCLESTGGGPMRVLGVFRPAGSPAAAYHPDGTPAFPGAPPITITSSKEEESR